MKTWLAFRGVKPLGEVTAPTQELAFESIAELKNIPMSEVVLEDPDLAKRLRKIAQHKYREEN